MPLSSYNSGARKAMASMKKQYGSNWKRVYYALANKRSGGVKGKNRGRRSANIAFAKGSGRKRKNRRGGRRRIRG